MKEEGPHRQREVMLALLACDEALARFADGWLAREIILKLRRALKRLDMTARSFTTR